MSDFQRQHPVAAVSRAFGLIQGNFLTILVFLFVGSQSENFPFLWWISGGVMLLLVIGTLNWWRFLYRIEDDTLHIKSGIFVRKDLYLTKDRIQVIDVTSGIIQRVFGLVKLDIQTAGSSSRQAAIDAITKAKASEINHLLRGHINDSIDPLDPVQAVVENEDEIIKTITLPHKELLIAASTSGSFGIALSLIATIFSQVEPLISDSEFFEYILSLLPNQTDIMMIVSIIASFVIFAWLISFISTLLSYGNFQLDIKQDEIIVSRGIFEKKRITVPYNRIQAIHVAEGIIREPLGYASVHLESAGYGDEKGSGSFVLFPLIKRSRILKLLNEIVPNYQKEIDGYKPPARSFRRYIFRSALLVTCITTIVYWFFELNSWIWLLPVLSVVWGWLRYRDAAIGWGNDILVLRSRFFSKSTAYIKKERVQDVTIRQSVFQQIRGLCSVKVFVASGDHGKSFSVSDLEIEDGYQLLREMKKGEQAVTDTESLSDTQHARFVHLPGWQPV